MKVVVLAAATGLIMVSAVQAGQQQRHIGSQPIICDNDGRCTNLNTTATPDLRKSRRHARTSGAALDRQGPPPLDANGNAMEIVSGKTGARARVGVAHAARFQAYIDDLENNYGARVVFMGGIRPGRCSIYNEHPCGKALDVCQLRRGVVDPRCNLPGRATLGQIAASHGLFEGGRWCDSDYGHAQVEVTAPACGESHTRIVQQ